MNTLPPPTGRPVLLLPVGRYGTMKLAHDAACRLGAVVDRNRNIASFPTFNGLWRVEHLDTHRYEWRPIP